MNEAETRAEHIDPALKAAGWGVVEGSRILREYPITLGRIEGQLMDATTALSPEGVLKMWLSIVPASSEQYLKTISSLFRMPGDKS